MEPDVTEVYDLYRSARLSEGYYFTMHARVSRWVTGTNFLLGVTATGSAATALPVWGTAGGQWIWVPLAVLAAIVADVRPFLGLEDRARRLHEEGINNRHLAFSLELLMREIRTKRRYDAELADRFLELLESTEKWLDADTGPEDQDLIREQTERVRAQYPESFFFYPWRDAHVGS